LTVNYTIFLTIIDRPKENLNTNICFTRHQPGCLREISSAADWLSLQKYLMLVWIVAAWNKKRSSRELNPFYNITSRARVCRVRARQPQGTLAGDARKQRESPG
jgi:hypothetical protein